MRAFSAISLSAIVFIAGCTPDTTGGTTSVSMADAQSVSTVDELLALGGHQLNEAEFRSELVDVTLDEGSWTWTINSDSTHSSAADDGSWSDEGGTWRLVNGRYCRIGAEGGTEKCSAVYRIGTVYRFADSDDSTKLAGWAVTRS